VFYQPIVDLRSRAVVAFDALLCWVHPTLGLLELNPRSSFASPVTREQRE
jgi:EAL domain-containing protein (putative c-di-GMP-specific phosphodiesterase class I)